MANLVGLDLNLYDTDAQELAGQSAAKPKVDLHVKVYYRILKLDMTTKIKH